MHAVTRLGRVIQQLRSFGELHASELEAMAGELEAAGAPELAARLRIYRDVQRDEGQIVVDELVDIQNDALVDSQIDAASEAQAAQETPQMAAGPRDPAVNSPKRARWLAAQAAEADRLKQPFSRRDFFARGDTPS